MAQRKQPTQATRLVEMARSQYSTVVDQAGQVFAVPKAPPHRAIPLSGKGALSRLLLHDYYERFDSIPNARALDGAIQVVEAEAMDKERTPVALRCARTANRLVIDLGDSTGRAAVIENGKWRIVKSPPAGVVFRSTRLTGAMPKPRRGGNLDGLRDLVNVTDEGWDLIRAWLVLAWLPDVPVPILSITGQQGAGKSVLGRTLVSVVDPSPAPLKSAPRDLKEWVTVAAASRVVGIDNISSISQDFSDALCRAVTGDGNAKRKLYENEDLVVQTSIARSF